MFKSETIVFLAIIGIVTYYTLIIINTLETRPPRSCQPTECASSTAFLNTRCPGGEIDSSYEICHSSAFCNSDQAPCTYDSADIGSICPGNPDYTSERKENTICTNKIICPPVSKVYFERQGEVFIQRRVWKTDTNLPRNMGDNLPAQIALYTQSGKYSCSLSEANLEKMWPSACVEGTLTKYNGSYVCI